MRTVGDKVYTEGDVSTSKLWLVWLLLIGLTAATWWQAYHHVGIWNLVIEMAISVTMDSLIVWYFMEMRSSPKLGALLFAMSLVMIAIAAALTLADYVTRGHT